MLNSRSVLAAAVLLGLVSCVGSPESKVSPQSLIAPSPIDSPSVSSIPSPSVQRILIFANKSEIIDIPAETPVILFTGIAKGKTMVLEVDRGTLFTITQTSGGVVRDYSNQEISDRQGSVVFVAPDTAEYQIELRVSKAKKVKVELRTT